MRGRQLGPHEGTGITVPSPAVMRRGYHRITYFSVNFNSIRRFCARASGLLPLAIG